MVIPSEKRNIFQVKGEVSLDDRERLHGHKGAAIWFTGLSASGKSTCAHRLEKILHDMGCSTYVFDGDNVRMGLCSDLGFTEDDRTENIRRIGEMVKLFVDAGIIAITAFISPYRKDRRKVRSLIDEGRFVEVHMDCPLDVCAERDKKGIYEKARAGIINNFTGISSPYEAPESPELLIRSHTLDVGKAALRITGYLKEKGIIC
ncbi:MAG: adenylyl-sulfate kinase [Deltaproteobacteria bacterium CG_4_8_14_3_um_filter_51_11]|nr:adenylyl-sulfate kinase [bacterium]OIP39169.1 MAG: adenylyl-sulfate kinase [Desulfobacteraceae bacterium CG2_30_51_40]PIP47953.1 MAG: adenylyl-sulfate kinase [Deltaproteobacteria bacterium CG23_combo_of_CG06-09_8_20_14_all_51_20]PIV98595.1 MAG: adenylyl-sulfate kinase [Deltaproteobacteria bacterium CG17_big_fil_post_rev_8_21_14_2_50_51_6]PIX19853.1 MAG: adenylyl-sulfate kinase [Deltaproteobacteria bacterium CG_4_8_14_3_um_filter_51_11]PIY24036.1 MAG: adenylyl-sulfate kinase [Deltaproteobact